VQEMAHSSMTHMSTAKFLSDIVDNAFAIHNVLRTDAMPFLAPGARVLSTTTLRRLPPRLGRHPASLCWQSHSNYTVQAASTFRLLAGLGGAPSPDPRP
jgi:hypothetical protein